MRRWPSGCGPRRGPSGTGSIKYRKSGDLPSTGQTQATADELQQLRKENSRLRMENDILKKAAAYFAREVMQ